MTFVAVLALALFAAFLLNGDIRRKIDALATAQSDSVQWSLAQADVELLALNAEVLAATLDPPASLAQLRSRFDIFYSRAQTLIISPQYAVLREDPEVAAALEHIDVFLTEAVPIIDGSDDALGGALSDLAARTDQVRGHVRTVTLEGVSILAETADTQRLATAQTLSWVSALTLGVVLILVLMLLFLLRHFRRERVIAKEQSLVQSRLAAVVSTSLDAVLVVDRQGRIMDFNGAAERVFGYSRDEAIGGDLAKLIVPDHFRDAHRAGMTRYLTTGEKRVVGTGLVQLEAKRKSGEVFPVELSISTAEADDGEIFVSFIRDISARVAAQEELVKARDDAVAGDRAKAEFIAVMSHEMRTPLNGMLGTLDLMDAYTRSAKEQEYLEIIRASGRLLLHHVDNVLELSRAEARQIETAKEVFDLPQLVRELVEGQRGVAQHRGNTLHVSVSHGCGDRVLGDPMRLRQILMNLVGNATKFTRDGRISVYVTRIEAGDEVEIKVVDTGIGIAPADQERVFEDFVTLDATYSREIGGTGLGLAIVKRFVEALNGRIVLDSALGQGSIFRVTLPLPNVTNTEAEYFEHSSADFSKAAGGSGLRILIVEDNRNNRVVLSDMLELDGHSVEAAFDGKQGVERVQNAGPYDLVFMDISMPGMDGSEATRTIRAFEAPDAHLPIVAVTAHADPAEADRFRAAGMDDVLVKPISRTTLRQTLSRLCLENSTVSDGKERNRTSVTSSVLDFSQIQELSHTLGRKKLTALAQEFIQETESAIDQICRHLYLGNTDTDLVSLIHHTAGSAALVGAAALRIELQALEARLKTALPLEVELPKRLLSLWEQTKLCLLEYLKR
ncbi:PAS domain-containing hybrid sensor histidine kinase/response regulator [Tropicibacter sp. Alg240-R139]|uniref:hybrid sensor histidine kinase/response regulator n=1 Tax=Tropicibacter sp. Alg240-R139 TaxID=2305991 RepID=UPI0013DF711D|nr:PAS domain-containing hybrid sensor histidine kinase/response regulator [Tropicibacter sp. Alg240-R139]